MIKVIRSKRLVTRQDTGQHALSALVRKVPQDHYLKKGRLFGHWADDWLTAWQDKHEE